jgi:hypothetical protein
MVSAPGEAARFPPPLPVRFGLTVATSNFWPGASAPASIITPTQTGHPDGPWQYLLTLYSPEGIAPNLRKPEDFVVSSTSRSKACGQHAGAKEP